MLPSDPKPAKLRSACNPCHAAKTKCSGQKTGCDRCHELDLTCKYEISMVGKVSGIRGRKRKSQDGDDGGRKGSNTCVCSATLTSTPSISLPTLGSPMDSSTSAAPGPVAAVPLTVATSNQIDPEAPVTPVASHIGLSELPIPELDMGINIDVFGNAAAPFASPQETLEVGDLETWLTCHGPRFQDGHVLENNTADMRRAQRDASAPARSPSLVFSPSVTASHSLLEHPAPHIQTRAVEQEEVVLISTCFEVIKALVATLNEKSNRLDRVLGACKSHITSLSAAIKDEDFEHSICCPTLVSTSLNLVIGVFERCIYLDDAHGRQGPGTSLAPHQQRGVGRHRVRFRYPLPSVSFGTLELDSGDQFALCSHLMREELWRAMALLALLRQRRMGRASEAAASALNVQEVWCEDFRKRLEALLGLLGNVGGSASPGRQDE